MSVPEKIYFCPDGAKHRWKDLRMRQKSPGPPFNFFQRCKRCNALKIQIIEAATKDNGDQVPKISTSIEQGDLFWEKPAAPKESP